MSWLPASKHNRKLLKNSENEITVEKRMSYVSRGLKVKEGDINLQKYLKENVLVITWLKLHPSPK